LNSHVHLIRLNNKLKRKTTIQSTTSIPDQSLRKTILAALAADMRTAGVDLRVGVRNRIVHLAGTLDSLAKRTAAEELALGVDGVYGVVNRIAAPGAPSPAREINLDIKKIKGNHI
jgi:osmotically-inducible protein OsmY